MPVNRSARRSHFTTLNNELIEAGLSWQALGLLTYVLSKPDHWKVSTRQLVAQVARSEKPTGRDGTYAILNELMASGYVTREIERDERGCMAGWSYTFHDEPAEPAEGEPSQPDPNPAYPRPGNPDTAEPYTARPNAAQPNTAKADSLVNTEKAVKTEKAAKTDGEQRATRLPADWTLPDEWLAWALGHHPTWNPGRAQLAAESFRDYWIAVPGAKGRKTDWQATWRNWVRREKPMRAVATTELSAAGQRTLEAGEAWLREGQ